MRTCIPNWAGRRYYTKLNKHINSEIITDEEAIEYLTNGILNIGDFKVLPEGYNQDVIEDDDIIDFNELSTLDNTSDELPEIEKAILYFKKNGELSSLKVFYSDDTEEKITKNIQEFIDNNLQDFEIEERGRN